jgi:hypothetical protein
MRSSFTLRGSVADADLFGEEPAVTAQRIVYDKVTEIA